MKQQISKKQWNELSKEEKDIFVKVVHGIDNRDDKILDLLAITNKGMPTIGQLIEFLGDDLVGIEYKNKTYLNDEDSFITVKEFFVSLNKDEFHNEKLIDALWKATKYKLKNL